MLAEQRPKSKGEITHGIWCVCGYEIAVTGILDMLLDYREYDGEWTTWFEENWLKPRLKALGYTHVRFFGGKTCEYDGSFRERVCELGKPGGARAEFLVYG
jgi:hypothetical protein